MTAPIRVMLVEDHALVRAAIRGALEAPDIEVVAEEASAEAAYESAMALRPEVILLDIDLPGLSGLQLVRELAPRLPESKIVMLSVIGEDRAVVEAMRFGAAGYLTKDLGPEALQRAVRGLRSGDLAMSRAMAARTLRQFIDRGGRGSADVSDLLGVLSRRERDVLERLADGLTDREIGDALVISPRTVETHVSSILRKLGVRNRAEAARSYREAMAGD